ncbi:MAG TPA: N-glycosylase [Thermodesulfobacteriota bacterium]
MSARFSESDKHFSELKVSYEEKKDIIKSLLEEFKEVFEKGDDRRIFEELTFCILTSAVGPRMGLKALNALKESLMYADEEELYMRLKDQHKYPEKAGYIIRTREYLRRECNFELKGLILSFKDSIDRRDFFGSNKDIKGIGYLQASHFLRNIGFFGYALLDKNILRSLYEYGILESLKPPTTRKRYLEIEGKMKQFADTIEISIDELDLLLWSERTGHIPK